MSIVLYFLNGKGDLCQQIPSPAFMHTARVVKRAKPSTSDLRARRASTGNRCSDDRDARTRPPRRTILRGGQMVPYSDSQTAPIKIHLKHCCPSFQLARCSKNLQSVGMEFETRRGCATESRNPPRLCSEATDRESNLQTD